MKHQLNSAGTCLVNLAALGIGILVLGVSIKIILLFVDIVIHLLIKLFS